MSKTPLFLSALGLQLAAQAFGGVWGAAVGGVIIGFALRDRGAFRIGFVAAALAAALLLAWVAVRGARIYTLAAMLGGNFGLPAWAIMTVTLLLPAVQAGGLAGGVARLLGSKN